MPIMQLNGGRKTISAESGRHPKTGIAIIEIAISNPEMELERFYLLPDEAQALSQLLIANVTQHVNVIPSGRSQGSITFAQNEADEHNLAAIHPRAEQLLEDSGENLKRYRSISETNTVSVSAALTTTEDDLMHAVYSASRMTRADNPEDAEYPSGWGPTIDTSTEDDDENDDGYLPISHYVQQSCIISDSPIGYRVTEPHGMEWHFVSKQEALMWAGRIDEENERWGDKPISLPFYMTITAVNDIDLNQAYHDGKEEVDDDEADAEPHYFCRDRRFATLTEATAYAELLFHRTGVVVAIEEVRSDG